MTSASPSNFPGFEHLYDMEHSPGRTWFYADIELDNEPTIFSVLRGEWIPAQPLRAYWTMGIAEPSDIASGRAIDQFYINQRVQNLFRDHRLTGWSTYPLILHNKAGQVCEGYAGLSITGRCSTLDEGRAVIVPGQDPDCCFPLLRGIYFDDSTWDGSDFFCPEGRNAHIFVTERVKEVFEDNHIAGFEFTSLREATWYGSRKGVDEEAGVDNLFLESLYMDQELDPAGFVDPFVDECSPGTPVDYTVIQPADNSMGMGLRPFSTFDEAKAYALHLQDQGVRQLVILRSHQVFWRTPGLE